MPTKYSRQRTVARRLITKFGGVCTWTKEGADTSSTLPPEMQPLAEAIIYSNIPIVLIPATRKEMFSEILGVLTATIKDQDVAYIPGDVPFTPANGDDVTIDGLIRYVDRINKIAPDGTAIAYEVTFK